MILDAQKQEKEERQNRGMTEQERKLNREFLEEGKTAGASNFQNIGAQPIYFRQKRTSQLGSSLRSSSLAFLGIDDTGRNGGLV